MLWGHTRHPLYGPYVRGELAKHGLNSRTPLHVWLDAVHATLATAPVETLKRMEDQMVVLSAAADPEGARATWGLLPEHQLTPPLETMRPPG